jgi:hypothetical protein
MKFDLFFPKTEAETSIEGAETVWDGQPGYIYVSEPYEGQNMVISGGRVLLTNESMTADECCKKIDGLIDDLRQLKAKARRRFKR